MLCARTKCFKAFDWEKAVGIDVLTVIKTMTEDRGSVPHLISMLTVNKRVKVSHTLYCKSKAFLYQGTAWSNKSAGLNDKEDRTNVNSTESIRRISNL